MNTLFNLISDLPVSEVDLHMNTSEVSKTSVCTMCHIRRHRGKEFGTMINELQALVQKYDLQWDGAPTLAEYVAARAQVLPFHKYATTVRHRATMLRSRVTDFQSDFPLSTRTVELAYQNRSKHLIYICPAI